MQLSFAKAKAYVLAKTLMAQLKGGNSQNQADIIISEDFDTM